jgi:serine/threonine-protein kinase
LEARWGKCLGRYELVAELGRGAMGVVYKARDPKIDRFVAVKTISLLDANPEEALEYRERFFQEAQAVGSLVHPGIVTVFDVGEEPENRTPYIVMEFVDGISLRELLEQKGGKLPLDTALHLAEELAEALDCAHGQGIVHRDIKPANILVTTSGRAKITDFGIAKRDLSHLTSPGHVLGTPAYMSPEQLDSEKVDGRSDLFSLGVILYSMISGFRPFQGNSVTTVCFKLANHDPVPCSALDPDLPPGVDAVISRAMAKSPADRYQRGLEFALDVRELRESLNSEERQDQSHMRTNTGLVRRAGLFDLASAGNPYSTIALADRWQGKTLDSLPAFARRILRRPPVLTTAFAVLVSTLTFMTWHRWTRGTTEASSTLSVDSSAPINTKNAGYEFAQVQPPEQQTKPTPENSNPDANSQKGKPASHAASHIATAHKSPPTSARDSTLLIGIDHQFSDGSISIWSDDGLLYSHSLRNEGKKHLVLFHAQAHESSVVRLISGQHRLRVHVQSSAHDYDEVKAISGTFSRGQKRMLQISFHGKENDMHLELR